MQQLAIQDDSIKQKIIELLNKQREELGELITQATHDAAHDKEELTQYKSYAMSVYDICLDVIQQPSTEPNNTHIILGGI